MLASFSRRSVARSLSRWSIAPAMRFNIAQFSNESTGPMGIIPDLKDQTSGLEKQELEAEQKGLKGTFGITEGALGGPFGTEDNPVMVPSAFDRRIVGCVGGTGDKAHDLLWHEVREGKPTVCMACGQFFALQKSE